MKYIQLFILFWKVLFNLRHFASFLEYRTDMTRKHHLEARQWNNKWKAATRRGEVPKKEHVFLALFFDVIDTKDRKERQKEMETLFCLLFLWYHQLSKDPVVEE